MKIVIIQLEPDIVRIVILLILQKTQKTVIIENYFKIVRTVLIVLLFMIQKNSTNASM